MPPKGSRVTLVAFSVVQANRADAPGTATTGFGLTVNEVILTLGAALTVTVAVAVV